MAVSCNDVDVVLNQSNTHSETGQGQIKKKKEQMVKLGNTQVNRGSKNVSLSFRYKRRIV